MRTICLRGIYLRVETELRQISEELIGKLIFFENKLVRIERHARRAGSEVWYYTQLEDNTEHFTSRLNEGVVLARFVQSEQPTCTHPRYQGQRLVRDDPPAVLGISYERPDPLIPKDKAMRFASLITERRATAFLSKLFEYRIEGPAIEARVYDTIRDALGAKYCRLCGRLHVEEGSFCRECVNAIATYAHVIRDDLVVPKEMCVSVGEAPHIRYLPIWEAVGQTIRCSVCGESFTLPEGGSTMCPACASKVRTCEICHRKINPTEQSVRVPDLGYYHRSCAGKGVEAGYHSNESHSNPIFFGSPSVASFPLFMGIELEGAGKRESSQLCLLADNIVRTKLADLRVETTRDGSLPGGGIEIISQPMTIEMWRDSMPKWKEALSMLPKYANVYGHDAKCAGLHVHVSKEAFRRYAPIAEEPDYREMVVFGRLIVLFARFQDELLFFSRREPDRKAQFARSLVSHTDLSTISEDRFNVEFSRLRERALENSGHYSELNHSPDNTLEFRLFRSTFNTDTLLATLEFVHGVCWFVANNGMQRCRTISFEELIREIDRPILSDYVERILARRSRAQDEGFEGEA